MTTTRTTSKLITNNRGSRLTYTGSILTQTFAGQVVTITGSPVVGIEECACPSCAGILPWNRLRSTLALYVEGATTYGSIVTLEHVGPESITRHSNALKR